MVTLSPPLMDGCKLRQVRRAHGWTQEELAWRLGVSQTYVSLLESGRRTVPPRFVKRVVMRLTMAPVDVPLTNETTPLSPEAAEEALGALGHPAFAHSKGMRLLNPAELLFRILSSACVDARLVEALPWVMLRHVDLDWAWLVAQAKLHDLQNRLGFVVTLARALAERRCDQHAAQALSDWERQLARSRLHRDDSFAGDPSTEDERRRLGTRRSPEAAQWNLLSDISPECLTP